MAHHKQRIFYVDALKCFVIFCVVYGHTLQWTCPGDAYFDDIVFSFIYSFHMPLFMTISGFFIGKTLNYSFLSFLKHRARQLILPVLSFTTVSYLSQIIYFFYLGGEQVDYLQLFLGGDMWFLKYLFVCSVVLWLSKRLFKNNYLVLLPTILLFVLTRSTIFRLLPFLWMGYAFAANKEWINRHLNQLLIASLGSFIFFLFFWTGDNYSAIYFIRLSGVYPFVTIDWHNTFFVVDRLMVGTSGSLFLIILFQKYKSLIDKIWGKKYISMIGQNTLGIYCLQIYILEYGISSLPFSLSVGFLSWTLDFMIALVVLIICHLIVELLRKNQWTNLLFLGNTHA